MPHYRVCVLDEHGQLGGVVNFDCLDDASPKGQVGRLADGHEVQLRRLVANSNLTIAAPTQTATKRPCAHALKSWQALRLGWLPPVQKSLRKGGVIM